VFSEALLSFSSFFLVCFYWLLLSVTQNKSSSEDGRGQEQKQDNKGREKRELVLSKLQTTAKII
jgi:hypothetical protein